MAPMEHHQCNDLHSTLQQISFDLNQTINTFLALQQCAPSPSNTGYTAYLESCLPHVQNLLKFFTDGRDLGEVTVRDFPPRDSSCDVTQAPDLAPVRDLIEQYLVYGNWMEPSNCLLEFDQILGSAVAGLAEAFESFLDELPAGSTEKLLLENSTRVALRKLRTREHHKE